VDAFKFCGGENVQASFLTAGQNEACREFLTEFGGKDDASFGVHSW